MNDYEKQGKDFLERHNLEFRVVLVGNDCPKFCEDAANDNAMDQVNVFPRRTHVHGKHYRVTVFGKDRGYVGFDFWSSYHDEESNCFHHGRGEKAIPSENINWDKHRGAKYPRIVRKPLQLPTSYDLFTSIQKSDPGNFEEFCRDYGYDSDSRRAEQTYHAVVEEWKKVRRFFTDAEIEELQEIQ